MIFDPKNPSATELFTVDFARQMPDVATISAALACQAVVMEGTDPTPASILSGAATFNGTKVSQWVTGGVDGVRYRLTFRCTLTSGQTLAETVDLWVRS